MEKPQPLLEWFEANGVVPEKGASVSHRNGVLHIINTAANIERIASLLQEHHSHAPKTVAFTLHTVQAPAHFLRALAHKTATSADHHEMWSAVEAAVAKEEATFISSLFLEAKFGSHATHSAACEHAFLSEFKTTASGIPGLSFDMRPVGASLEIEAVGGSDDHTVEITFAHQLHSAAPMTHREHFRDAASKKDFEMPLVDFHSIQTISHLAMTTGGIKLISLSKPTGREDVGALWATFLKCDVVHQFAKPRPDPTAAKPETIIDPKAWNSKHYRVPPGFLSSSGQPPSPRMTARRILEGVGVPFPDGATASYNPATSIMFVKNTNENLALVDAYVESITKLSPKNVAFTTHVIQGPGPLLRRLTAQAATKSDHGAELDELLAAVKAGTVQHLNIARIETKSGTPATARQGREHSAISAVSINDQGEPLFTQQMRNVGLNVHLEPTVGPDGLTIELTLAPEFHTAPPLEHREYIIDTQGRRLEFPLTDYFTSKVTTGITIPGGTSRLISLYRPVGKPEFEKEDLLQAIFITCDILRVEE